jgi:hypothetical protein
MAGLFSWLKSGNGQSNKRDYTDNKFKVGQIWNYNTRIGEENSTIEILKVEKYDSTGIVVHIFVSGIKVKNPHKSTGFSEEIGHLPLSKDAVLMSVTTLVSENNKLPDFEEGYNNWKEAFNSKKGGIFSITVQDAVKYVEEAINNSKPVKE